jgi:hypothetical protein
MANNARSSSRSSSTSSTGSATRATSKTVKSAGQSGDPIHAPGKRHRKPAPAAHGVKHSDERIAKLRLANANRQRRSGG